VHTDREPSQINPRRLARLGTVTSSRLSPTRLAVLLSGLVAAFALLVAPARAGTYVVSTCKAPNGLLAATNSWSYTPWAASIDHWIDTCPAGGVRLTMDPDKVHPKDDTLTARWSAPANTFIVGYTYWRSVQVGAGTWYFFSAIERRGSIEEWVGPSCRGDTCKGIGSPSTPLAAANRWDRTPPQPVTAIGLYLSCGYSTASEPDCPKAKPAIDVVMHRADITLSDDLAPTFAAAPSGGLLDTTRTLTGKQAVAYQATDKGGGVASASVEVDGRVATTVAVSSGTCKTPYTTAVPCPLTASGTINFDTASVPDGDHQVRILLTDAAGNITPWGPVKIRTYNTPVDTSCVPDPVVTSGATLTARTQRVALSRSSHPKPVTRLTVEYGRKTQVRGVLRGADGAPIANTPLCLVWRENGTAETWTPLARTTTGLDGSYTVPLPTGSSREMLAIYRVGQGAVIGRTVLQVRPTVSAKARRRVLHNGQVLQITGKLSGGPYPHRGVVLNLQAIRDGRWQGFANSFRTDSNGRFKFRYRFTRTLGVQRYRMRIRAVAQAGYPYISGFSKRLTIRVVGS
jgi:hypothetical protein